VIPFKQVNAKHDPANGVVGDCFRACVCSILEIDPIKEHVPNFASYPDDQWWNRFICWAKSKKCAVCWSTDPPPADIEYYIATGTSPRGFLHAVIYSKGKLVHDPHPNGGDVKNIVDYLWLTPIDVVK
jgi:hypothetical protein